MTNCLNELVIDQKIPILGICLGMQLLCNYSEEGNKEGLGWINADVIKFNFNVSRFKIPHMGWNTVKIKEKITLTKKMKNGFKFYFVHSYFPKLKQNNYA